MIFGGICVYEVYDLSYTAIVRMTWALYFLEPIVLPPDDDDDDDAANSGGFGDDIRPKSYKFTSPIFKMELYAY